MRNTPTGAMVARLPWLVAVLMLAVGAAGCAAADSDEDAAVANQDAQVPVIDRPDASGGEASASECRTSDDCAAPDFCTNARRCVDRRCVVVGGAPDCDDHVTCTSDRCDPAAGRCAHQGTDALCPMGRVCDPSMGCVQQVYCEVGDSSCQRLNTDPCNGLWSCDGERNRCVRGPPPSCDDRDDCTTDRCVNTGQSYRCENTRVAMAVDCRGRACGATRCTPSCGVCAEGECVDGACVTCPECQVLSGGRCVPQPDGTTCGDDGMACTQDVCTGGTCSHPPRSNDCGTPSPALECGPSPSGCFSCGTCPTGQYCQMGRCGRCPDCTGWNGRECAPLADGSACTDDGRSCTQDRCAGGTCRHTTTSDCGARECGPSPSGCVPSCGVCRDGPCVDGRCVRCPDCQYWNGSACVPVTDGLACSTPDSDACTQDVCVGGVCSHARVSRSDDCGTRVCGASPSGCSDCGTCTTGPCRDGVCARCPECQGWNGTACVPLASGACTPDASACTQDVCAGGACTHPPIANDCGAAECGRSPSGCFSCGRGDCPPGQYCAMGRCTGCPECQVPSGSACVPATDGIGCAPDADPCTQDVCASGSCRHSRIANDCGARTCGMSPSGCFSCGSTACSDGDVCTTDSCSSAGVCSHAPVNDCGGRVCGASPSGCVSSCGTCPTGRSCDGSGACVVVCSGGRVLCGGTCVDTNNDNANCGACGRVCPGGRYCAGGSCVCSSGTLCGGSCVNTNTDSFNCGACGRTCPSGQYCSGGSCACSGGTLCGGTCVDTSNDNANCGACGRVCPGGRYCAGGSCVCSSGTLCGGSCVNTNTDSFNCGACGRTCPSSQYCAGGSCACYSGTLCGGACVSTSSDFYNCGGCGRSCSSGQYCSGGSCSCYSGTLCGGACVNTSSDFYNCGGCGRACSPGQSCSGGSCSSPLPDLTITGFSPPGTIGRGIYYAIPTTVTRTGGNLSGGSVLVQIYLSRDASFSTDDYRASLGYSSAYFPASSLNSLGSVRQSVECAPGDVSLPPRLDTGFYYWLAVVDPGSVYGESSESNNVFVGGTVTVY